jgi:oxygen-dependent protoporphyrinogen oxidase
LLSIFGKARAALDLVLPARAGGADQADETLASFVRRRFGSEALDHLAQPMVAGIYTADAEQLSLQATFPEFLRMEAEHRSVILALKRRRAPSAAGTASGPRYGLFATLRHGLSTLVQAMVDRLPAGSVRMRSRVERVARTESGWTVSVAGSADVTADAVCLALSAPVAGEVLGSVDPTLSDELKGIPYASPVTVNLAYQRPHVRHALDGFGFVVPAIEGRALLACTFSSVKFAGRAPEGAVLLRAFLGGALHPEMDGLGDADLAGMAHEELKGYLTILGEPMFAEVHRHPRSMPQYHLGHLERVARIRERVRAIPGLALAGNAYAGIGLPDCIRSGEAAAASLLA